MEVDRNQVGQDCLGFPEDLEALVEGPLSFLLSFLHFGKDQAAERANAVRRIVQHYGKCSPQLLTVWVVRPVFGGKFG